MARVKTFRIHPQHGVPDKDIREFLNVCEQDAFVNVTATFIPSVGEADPRLTVIVTKLDEKEHDEIQVRREVQLPA